MEVLRVQVPAHLLHPRTEEPAQQDSLSLESLISAATLLSVFQPEVGTLSSVEGLSLTADNLFPVCAQENYFLFGSRRSTTTRVQATGLTCRASDLKGCLLTVM